MESVAESEHSAATYWNREVAQPANQQLQGTKQHKHTQSAMHRRPHVSVLLPASTGPYSARLVVCAGGRLAVVRSDFHRLRDRYALPAVLTSTAVVAAVSLASGRFAALRNAALTALVVGWLVRPSLVTGMLAASTDGIVATKQADWSKRGEQIVRQQQQPSDTRTMDSSMN